MKPLHPIVRRLLPQPLRKRREQRLIARSHVRNAARSASDVFAEIYKKKMWSNWGDKDRFCSGSGSSGEAADAYQQLVVNFIKEHGVRSVVDVGCGDFRIGRALAEHVALYTGVDVVEELIEHHREHHASESVRFLYKDAVSDPLPEADLCLVRQVLQHLSNDQILGVLNNIRGYRYVLVTEHYPVSSADFVPNRDKIHGADIRAATGSAVVLQAPPFNWPEGKLVLSVPLGSKGEIRTFLFVRGSS